MAGLAAVADLGDSDERETIGRYLDELSDWNLRVLINDWLEDIEVGS